MTQTRDAIPMAGSYRRGLPIGRTYTYRGDGHDTINPDQCDCGRCGNKIRAARAALLAKQEED